MRLSKSEIKAIIQSVEKHLGPKKIYLFGSRTDDSKRGGDIDLLVISSTKPEFMQQRQILLDIYKEIGEQKIDIIYASESDTNEFAKIALKEGVLINHAQ